MKTPYTVVTVIPNLNGEDYLAESIDSVLAQTVPTTIVVVDNASTDNSMEVLHSYNDKIVTIIREKNYGFTGGVNPGIDYAFNNNFDFVALLNNDARVDTKWLEELLADIPENVGASTGSLLMEDGSGYDTTGECFTDWGLAFPRDRGGSTTHKRSASFVFGATGGATLYRVSALQEVGKFDQNFFAYNEDVDLSFRLQLAGWKVRYVPDALAYHRLSQTTKKMYKGFAVYHTFKNLPLVLHKNLPKKIAKPILKRFWLAYIMFTMNAMFHGAGKHALKGYLAYRELRKEYPHKSSQVVSDEYIRSLFAVGPPPGSSGLLKLDKLSKRLGIRL